MTETIEDTWYLSADMHSDVGPTIFLQLSGRKLWRIVDLKYSHLLQPIWFKTYGRSHAYDSNYFDLIPRWEAIVNPGDLIIFPVWMWHEVYVDHNDGFELSMSIKLFREKYMMNSIKRSFMFTWNTLASVAYEQLFSNERKKIC